MSETSQDQLNRTTWSKPDVARWFASLKSFTDPGERAYLEHVGGLGVRGQPVLDLGVGAGRTIPLLREISADYLGIDYLPSMVEASRRAHPDARVELGDARSLETLPHAHFALVNFSFNGIDAVSHQDRPLIFRAVARVLRPGGFFAFSSLNLEGPGARERPWKVRINPTHNPLRWLERAIRSVALMPIDFINWLRIRDAEQRGEGYAVAPLSAHHFGVLAHYTTLDRQLAELAAHGFESVDVFECTNGQRVAPGESTSRHDWLHFIARRSTSGEEAK